MLPNKQTTKKKHVEEANKTQESIYGKKDPNKMRESQNDDQMVCMDAVCRSVVSERA
jgi:hypothetical protein